jgi:hypothetical protein
MFLLTKYYSVKSCVKLKLIMDDSHGAQFGKHKYINFYRSSYLLIVLLQILNKQGFKTKKKTKTKINSVWCSGQSSWLLNGDVLCFL